MTFLYGVKRFRIHSTLSLENVYERIFNHSQFFPTLFDHRSDNTLKGNLFNFLMLFFCSSSVFLHVLFDLIFELSGMLHVLREIGIVLAVS